MRPLFARLSNDTAKSYALVLTSLGIPYQLYPRSGWWAIEVQLRHRRGAVRAISLYLSENRRDPAAGRRLRFHAVKTYSAFYICAVLTLIHLAVKPGHEHQFFVATFGADAARILSGEIYRCATALLFHADSAHLAGNLAALALFGTAAASICGWGLGWMMVLASGVAGNFATAWWYGQGHNAIGASTAVFGAVGICSALSFWLHARQNPRSGRMWLPLAGGLALLGFMGTSPHSDLMAHLWGFACGTLIGVGYGWWCRKILPLPVQLPVGLAAAAILGTAWIWGMHYSG